VAPKPSGADSLFGTTWVHVFEEDTAKGAVYRPDDSGVPLSRRPRERLRVKAGGSAVLFVPGPDDRFIERAATWKDEGDALVIRASDGGDEIRIVERSPARLVVQIRRARTT